MDTSTNRTDYFVSLAKGGAGLIPVVGAFIAEFIGTIVPNQRMDRISRFVSILGEAVASVEEAHFKARTQDPDFLDLFEDGLLQAARSQTEERMRYIAAVISHSFSDDDVDYAKYKHILALLKEINDIQVLLLKSEHITGYDEYQEFWRSHQKVLDAELTPDMRSSQDDVEQYDVFASYRHHLVRLGLLQHKFMKPRSGELPEFDENTGMVKARGYNITRLGELLLRMIHNASGEDQQA